MKHRYPRPALGALTAALVVALAACSSSTSTGGANHTGAPAPPSAPATKTASAPKAASALTGKWRGRYSGSYNGTFSLRWHQSGSHLSGRITISSPRTTLPINGTVTGSAIKFGTVGSMAITYSGTVSGSSMSGTYQVHGGNGSAGGPWSASKE